MQMVRRDFMNEVNGVRKLILQVVSEILIDETENEQPCCAECLACGRSCNPDDDFCHDCEPELPHDERCGCEEELPKKGFQTIMNAIPKEVLSSEPTERVQHHTRNRWQRSHLWAMVELYFDLSSSERDAEK